MRLRANGTPARMAYTMRPAGSGDLDALMRLADLSGPGFTSLPVSEPILAARLLASEAAFAGQLSPGGHGKYLLMMEDEQARVCGSSAVKTGVGIDQPFFNFRVITVAQASLAAKRRFDMDVLILTNEFVGYTEVGTLFLAPEARGGGAGRLAAQSRYLLMANEPARFGGTVLSELRGVSDEKGKSPFWEHLGSQFFRMSFPEADEMSAVTDNQFILDLMPKYPIYIDLLAPEAREVIGRCHADGVGAKALLEWEGFRFERTVDIFDGGPLMAVRASEIRTSRESLVATLHRGKVSAEDAGLDALVSRTGVEGFRSTQARLAQTGEHSFACEGDVLERLQLGDGAEARVFIKR